MRSGLGITLAWPMKNDIAAMNSAKHIRHKCLASRDAPTRAPVRSSRRSPAVANSPTMPNKKKGKGGIPFRTPPLAIAWKPNVELLTPATNDSTVPPTFEPRSEEHTV